MTTSRAIVEPVGAASEIRRQPFFAHVQELRQRLFLSLLAIILGSSLGFYLRQHLVEAVQSPLGQPIYYQSPIGGLSFLIKICFFFGVLVSIPFLLWQLFRFLEPAMARSSRRFLMGTISASILLVAAGVSLGYFVSLPSSLQFLQGFDQGGIQSLISADQYLSFVLLYLTGFALLFQLPLVMLIINRITPLRPGQLMAQQGHVILAIFVAAAILTPTPDPINQIVVAVPVIGLYQVSIVLIWWANRPKRRRRISPVAAEAPRKTEEAAAVAALSAPAELESSAVESTPWHADSAQPATLHYVQPPPPPAPIRAASGIVLDPSAGRHPLSAMMVEHRSATHNVLDLRAEG
jgi:sec-independent protein translocase protein TatC